jgi:hypothetical protein
MKSFQENVIGVCKAVGRVAPPLMGLAAATYAGAEAAEVLNMSTFLGGFAGMTLGTLAWMGFEASNAPTEEELFGCKLDIVSGGNAINYIDVESDQKNKKYRLFFN